MSTFPVSYVYFTLNLNDSVLFALLYCSTGPIVGTHVHGMHPKCSSHLKMQPEVATYVGTGHCIAATNLRLVTAFLCVSVCMCTQGRGYERASGF
jgi:hypothetical protein